MTDKPNPSEDDVLNDFLSEAAQDRATLERYLQLYPMHAGPLLDLQRAIAQQRDLETEDERWEPAEAWVANSVARLRERLTVSPPADPFQNLSPARFNAVKAKLGVRSSTLTGLRDRLVNAATVPRHVLRELAEALGTALDGLVAFLELPPRTAAQSFRAEGRPQVPGDKVTFEELLIASNEPPETRARLLEEGD